MQYSAGGGRGNPAPELSEEAKPVFFAALRDVQGLLPQGVKYGDWRRLSGIDLEDRYALVYGHLAEDDELRDTYLQAELRLTQAFLLVKHLDDCRPQLETAVRDLVDDSVESEGVVDIFKVAGIERADISILDDRFLQTFKDRPLVNLRLKLLEKLMYEEIASRQSRNLAMAKSFRELLEQTLRKYHNRLIDAAAVIKAMLQIHREIQESEVRAKELGLDEEELAFYDAVAAHHNKAYGVDFLRDLIHDVVQTVKRNLKVDWAEPHRDDVKSEIRAAVKRVLRKREVRAEDFDPLVERIMEQAEALYADWPVAA